jgi:hypothetical protein
MCLANPALQEEQEQLAEVEAEARAELNAAQAALREAQEAVAISADKVAQLTEALKEAKVGLLLCLHIATLLLWC